MQKTFGNEIAMCSPLLRNKMLSYRRETALQGMRYRFRQK